jgi:HK97 family phage prohead protease
MVEKHLDNTTRDEGPELYTRADVAAIRPEKREVDVIASTESLDSHGTVLLQNWKLDRYLKNPVVLFGHDRISIPVATAKNVKVQGSKKANDRRLTATFKFRDEGKSQHADEVWAAVEDGTLKGISVGFRSHSQRIEKADDREYLVLDDNELFEISVVPVPSNADTLANMRSRAFATHDLTVPHEDTLMNEDLNTLVRTIGLEGEPTSTDINSRVASLIDDRSKLLTATGADSIDSALAIIEAGRQAIITLETERKAHQQTERENILKQLRAENKVTPALESKFLFTLDLEGLRTFAEVAPALTFLGDSGLQEASRSASPATPFEKMTSIEKAALKRDDIETYNTLRNEWIAKGRPTAK